MQDVFAKVPEVFTLKLDRSFSPDMLWNLSPAELVEEALKNGEGSLTSTGALMCDTGKFTGRAPKDRYIVKDAKTENTVWWGEINQPISEEQFDSIYGQMLDYLKGKKALRPGRLCGCRRKLPAKHQGYKYAGLAESVLLQYVSQANCGGAQKFSAKFQHYLRA